MEESQRWLERVTREVSTGSSVVNLDLEEDVFHLESSIADQVASSSVDKRSSTPSSSGRQILDQEDEDLSALASPLRF